MRKQAFSRPQNIFLWRFIKRMALGPYTDSLSPASNICNLCMEQGILVHLDTQHQRHNTYLLTQRSLFTITINCLERSYTYGESNGLHTSRWVREVCILSHCSLHEYLKVVDRALSSLSYPRWRTNSHDLTHSSVRIYTGLVFLLEPRQGCAFRHYHWYNPSTMGSTPYYSISHIWMSSKEGA